MRLSLRRFQRREDVKEEPDSDAEDTGVPASLPLQAPRRTGEQDAITAKEDMLKVRDLKFTHDTVARSFRDGSTFHGLMRDLRGGQVDPQVNL